KEAVGNRPTQPLDGHLTGVLDCTQGFQGGLLKSQAASRVGEDCVYGREAGEKVLSLFRLGKAVQDAQGCFDGLVREPLGESADIAPRLQHRVLVKAVSKPCDVRCG